MKYRVIKALICTLGLSGLIVQCDFNDIFGPTVTGAAIGGAFGGGRGAAIGASVGATAGIMHSTARDESRRRSRRRYYHESENNDRAYYRKLRKERRTLERSLTGIEAEIAAIERGDVTAAQGKLARLRKEHKQLIGQLDEIEDDIDE